MWEIVEIAVSEYDPLQNFDLVVAAFRKSVGIYLIENAAIHDAAWLIKMPAAKKYKHSLSDIIDRLGLSIQNCNLINTVEHQTRKQ